MKSPRPPFQTKSHRRDLLAVALRGLWIIALALLLPPLAPAQEALRASIAGQDAAEARKRALANQRFNLKLGPVSLRFSGNLSTEATDNIRSVEDNPQADLGIRAQLNTFALWRVTERNSLTLGLGLGYVKYLETTDYDSIYISPDTDLSFDIYVGDFLINLHDRFDYTQDVTSDPTISGTGSLSRFENTLGIRTIWDLNKAFVSASYDHRNYIATETKYKYLTHVAELMSLSAGFQITPTLQTGLEISGGMLDYQQNLVQDNQHVAIGPFLNGQLTEYTSFQLGAGYVVYFLDELISPGGTNTLGFTNAASVMDAFYVGGAIRQRVGDFLTHSLTFSRSVQSGIASQLLDLWRVEHSASWTVLRKTGVGTSLSYEHGFQPGLGGETLDRIGGGLSFSRTITQHATARLGYQVYYKQSDTPGRGYLQNRLVLNLTYTF